MNVMEPEDILTGRWQPRGSFNKQVASILHAVRLSKPEVIGLQTLYDDVVNTFRTLWPDCALRPFGSVVTGLSFKNSDVDCILDQCGDEPHSCVDMAARLVASGPGPFLSAEVKHKRVPSVKLVHAVTRRVCDLSFSGPLAVEFTELVGSLLDLDPRALKLAILVKCWAHVNKLTTGQKRCPSNALIILIIFFLQSKGILPAVAELQENCSPKMIDNWNTAFTVEGYESSNSESLYKLCVDFFVYYEHFDFNNVVICPYLGYPLQRHELLDIDSLPPDFELYKANLSTGACEVIFTNSNMCIQDPFDHSRNCASHLKYPLVGEMFNHFKAAAHVCKNTSEQKVLSKLLSHGYGESEQPRYREHRGQAGLEGRPGLSGPSRFPPRRNSPLRNRQQKKNSKYADRKSKKFNHRTKKFKSGVVRCRNLHTKAWVH